MIEFLEILLIVGPVGLILILLCMYYGEDKKYIINVNENVNENMNLLS